MKTTELIDDLRGAVMSGRKALPDLRNCPISAP